MPQCVPGLWVKVTNMANFKDYGNSPLMPDILPIIPKDGKLSPRSKLTPERIGKIPGIWTDDGWIGFPNWTRHRNRKPSILEAFDIQFGKSGHEPIVGLQAEEYPAIDVDCEDPEVIRIVKRVVGFFYPNGTLIRQRSNSNRILLMFKLRQKATPFAKGKMRFTVPSDPNKICEIEVPARGQQYLIEGLHPSGVPYEWACGLTPLTAYNLIAETDGEMMSSLLQAVRKELQDYGCNFDLSALRGAGGSGDTTPERVTIGSEHFDVAPSLDDLKGLLATFPCTHPDLADRDEWIKFLVAIKAAAAGDEQFFDEVVLPWCLEYADNTEEYVRERWESFHDASLGWNYLFAFTQADNHEGIAKLFADDADWAALDAGDVPPQTAIPEQKRNAPIPKLMPDDFDLHKLPRRQFVLGNRFMSGVVTLGVGPPGAAKSTLAILAALSIATGERLSGEVVHRPGRVWIHNNEDSLDELYRRIGGMLKYHDIDFTRVRENIFVTSGLVERLIVAVKEKDIVKMQQAVSEMIASIRREGINHIVVDPFVSTHRGVSENSNEEMEQVIDCFRVIAHETGCSIDLIHHASKQTETPGNMNAARGASSLIGAVRMVYTLTPMSKKMAEEMNKGLPDGMKVSDDQVARLVRLDHAKGNYSPRDTRVSWFELESYNIGNATEPNDVFSDGDTIAVPKPWTPPNAAAPSQRGQDQEAERRDMLQRVRDFVAATMPSDQCLLKEILPEVRRQFEMQDTRARELLKQAIPEGATAVGQANNSTYSLILKREGQRAPHPITIVRVLIRPQAQAA